MYINLPKGKIWYTEERGHRLINDSGFSPCCCRWMDGIVFHAAFIFNVLAFVGSFMFAVLNQRTIWRHCMWYWPLEIHETWLDMSSKEAQPVTWPLSLAKWHQAGTCWPSNCSLSHRRALWSWVVCGHVEPMSSGQLDTTLISFLYLFSWDRTSVKPSTKHLIESWRLNLKI